MTNSFKQLRAKKPVGLKKPTKVLKSKTRYKRASASSGLANKTARSFRREVKSAWRERMKAKGVSEESLLEFKQLKGKKFKGSKAKGVKSQSKYKRPSRSKFMRGFGKGIKKALKGTLKNIFFDKNGNLRPLRGPRPRRESVELINKLVLERYNEAIQP